jgi:hypothetical protein
MKNFLLVLFGIIVLLVLWWLTIDQEKIPHVILAQDTTETNIKGKIEGGNAKIVESADPSSMIEDVKAEFLGKTFHKCLSIIYKIPNSQIEEIENNAEGISFINAYVKGTHHMLYFDNGICTTDEILKD